MSEPPVNPTDLEQYIRGHTSPEGPALYQLHRETHLTAVHPRMLSGPIQGKFLEILCHLLAPARILEIGTFTGYSSICMARGLAPRGRLHTIEKNEEVAQTAWAHIERAHLGHCITLHVGDALTVIPTLGESFDLVLIDGDKREYPQYLALALPAVRKGGLIMADNVLWGGKVADPTQRDPQTLALREFNTMVAHHPDLDRVLLPLRDGLMLARRLR